MDVAQEQPVVELVARLVAQVPYMAVLVVVLLVHLLLGEQVHKA
jgi:hypothetical protein